MFSKQSIDIETTRVLALKKEGAGLDAWEKECEEVFYLIRNLVKENISNGDLTIPLPDTIETWEEVRKAYLKQYTAWSGKENDYKYIAAKHWLFICVFVGLCLREYFANDHHYLATVFFILLAGAVTKLYQAALGTTPLQSVGSLLFNRTDRKDYEVRTRFDIAYLQAERAGPMNPLRLFNFGSSLERAVNSKEIPVIEHTAILRGLFGLKNNSYDCTSVASLVILALLERKIPFSIERMRTTIPSEFGHQYIVVNRDQDSTPQNLRTWNPDAILIDPWYGLCLFAEQIQKNPWLLMKYPLLNPADKIASESIRGDTNSMPYQIYLALFQNLRKQHDNHEERTVNCLDVIYPRLAYK